MSQASQAGTAVAPAPVAPASPAAPVATAGVLGGVRARLSGADTPALLNRWQLLGMATALLFALVSATLQFVGWQSDGRAADDTQQLIRVQEIQSSLLRADALATNAFLVGGLEDPARRAEYESTLDDVARAVTAAAEAQPADREVLAALNVEITDYATAVSQARDNNRQGFPIGAEYLSGASSGLRADALPLLKALVDANTERADGSLAGQHPVWLTLTGVVALGVLVWLNARMAQRFRRRVNRGVAVAAALVVLVTLVTGIAAAVRDTSNDDLARGDLATAISQARARTAANDAKTDESLRLIRRGSGAGFEEAWTASAAIVDASVEARTEGFWQAYVDVHRRIVELDDGGQWRQAVELAVSRADGGSSAALDAFDARTAEIVSTSGATVTRELRSGRGLALATAALTLLLGVVAAAAVARGVNERRREFA